MASETEERDKAMIDIHKRWQATTDVLRKLRQRDREATVTKQRMELVLKELQDMPDDMPTYQQIGRAYFLESKPAVVKSGAAALQTASVGMESCKAKIVKYEADVKNMQKEMQELAASG